MAHVADEGLGSRTVGELVAEDYRRAAVFQRFGIDFCCGGGVGVRATCEKSGVAWAELERALAASDGWSGAEEPDPRDWELDVLAEHIVAVHHDYVRDALPALLQFSDKVARVHGERHPELGEIRRLVAELAAALTEHLEEEERVLFPAVARLVSAGDAAGASSSPDSVVAPLAGLEDDHERAGDIMRRVRELSADFAAPADACNTYRALYAKLAEFEADLHRHVHLENNVLFPRARVLAGSTGGAAEA